MLSANPTTTLINQQTKTDGSLGWFALYSGRYARRDPSGVRLPDLDNK